MKNCSKPSSKIQRKAASFKKVRGICCEFIMAVMKWKQNNTKKVIEYRIFHENQANLVQITLPVTKPLVKGLWIYIDID